MNLQYLMLNYMYVLFYISLLLSKELMYFTFFICNSNSGKYVAQKLRELTNPIRLTNQGEVTVQVAINNALLNYTMLMLPAAKMPLICIEMEKCLSYLRENKTMILRLIIDIAMIIGCLVDFCIEVAKEKNFHFEYAFGLLDVVFYYLSRQIYLHVGFQVHFYGTLDCICDFRQIFCNLLAVRPLGLKVKRIYSFYGVYITFYAMPQKLIPFIQKNVASINRLESTQTNGWKINPWIIYIMVTLLSIIVKDSVLIHTLQTGQNQCGSE
eukprot:TRINITY_DN4385_c0_g1_i1.p2 TRINITY_DN4385_c0_g1~~TRINITY_DN4385_c0_g1_i1.p2  ORF type:complete len:268 (+),score=6.34 TRINITY_DN4385_c0_g1_i1:1671-2474(+)